MITPFLSLNFGLFIIGAFVLFEKIQFNVRLRIMSITVILCMIGELIGCYYSPSLTSVNFWASFTCLFLSLSLFAWTAYWIKEISNRKLPPIYTVDSTAKILTKGPFKLIRHPFYTSYLLSFLGGAISINQYWALGFFLVPFCIYFFASKEEEAHLSQGKDGPLYLQYMRKTGRFFPKLFQSPK